MRLHGPVVSQGIYGTISGHFVYCKKLIAKQGLCMLRIPSRALAQCEMSLAAQRNCLLLVTPPPRHRKDSDKQCARAFSFQEFPLAKLQGHSPVCSGNLMYITQSTFLFSCCLSVPAKALLSFS